ncbi:hypothetical protein M0R45_036018 [Rubus argutus]|uniref:Uncharacterized protein n=1 Tax=Rubus argutus TaxID=59490 RepID=A0AAW1W0D0_RUBAR
MNLTPSISNPRTHRFATSPCSPTTSHAPPRSTATAGIDEPDPQAAVAVLSPPLSSISQTEKAAKQKIKQEKEKEVARNKRRNEIKEHGQNERREEERPNLAVHPSSRASTHALAVTTAAVDPQEAQPVRIDPVYSIPMPALQSMKKKTRKRRKSPGRKKRKRSSTKETAEEKKMR